ncbi:branched-chain amino acid transaminase [Candidatus Peregrinibacteria bacterium]|nr:branched-chain amino acid transaminase [Candidatus Peregrinibacteria bacterium]
MAKTFPYAYIRKGICRTKQATIPIQCKAVQYGIGYFTGIRGYYNKDTKQLNLFRLKDHHRRLRESAKITQMKFNMSYVAFEKTLKRLIKKNKVREDIYLRITLYALTTDLTPRFDKASEDLAIYMISLKDYFKSDKGLNICISSWRRYDDDMMSVKAKVTGTYANSAYLKTEAVQNGFDEGLFLNRDGKVCEASGANIFGIKGDKVFTPPLSANVLNGITRASVIEIIEKETDLTLIEEEIDRSTLYTFDELFFTGTAAKITPIRSVDRRIIGTGRHGKHTKKIQEIFDQITLGKIEKYNDWLTPAT